MTRRENSRRTSQGSRRIRGEVDPVATILRFTGEPNAECRCEEDRA